MEDYKERKYLSSIEAAMYLNTTVSTIHHLAKSGEINSVISGSGQKRFNLKDLKKYLTSLPKKAKPIQKKSSIYTELEVGNTVQKIYRKSSIKMSDLEDESVHLMLTSPPYFNAKMYSKRPIKEDLGNIHDLDEWFETITEVWREVFRVLQPGRKAFINIMNLPVRGNGTFRTLNLVGRTVDVMEQIGFIFKRDIIWQKTNGVRAHFGTYPYPGGILINNMHEFILEFNKPERKNFNKYAHLSRAQKESSRMDKNFWLSIKNSDVWVMKPENSGGNRSHVAPFPFELPFRIIKAFSFIGETILDPFLGSGTALKAAADLGRNGVGYELSKEIADDAITNLKKQQIKLFA
ncbi:MAG: DNA-binding protein [Candidatus Levybacteria bacterium RIFCSPHIGHO2_12_FULL_39_39]|nr:MAG: modification methylase protein [Candidatus Levybacteria bacterium GW2011_GWB1_39_7]KKR27079.1 MAG: modification methylase protein [Microgenomates group bacterium GW2011_GWC1_39_7]KKR50101.1 MAG: modification methylase protein [Candidatus Levybacteria bacterium GW2011_GWA2_40_16]OGH25352.1 MAG: DNA-binding protein [Candidatus Levybacteria bacterium RIFCSPHIGHO2_12_FULL_39_39]OGH46954.1 MAG: DNA-binding protein [Candidatus Levybacteria bacterium RIFCSPLOWO2_12_FULL_39_17]